MPFQRALRCLSAAHPAQARLHHPVCRLASWSLGTDSPHAISALDAAGVARRLRQEPQGANIKYCAGDDTTHESCQQPAGMSVQCDVGTPHSTSHQHHFTHKNLSIFSAHSHNPRIGNHYAVLGRKSFTYRQFASCFKPLKRVDGGTFSRSKCKANSGAEQRLKNLVSVSKKFAS